jgi:hypothetical protein
MGKMDAEVIENISRSIHRQFPELAGVQPLVRAQTSQKDARPGPQTYLLTYQSKVPTAAGKRIERWVRVTATSEGKILKVSTSR